MLCETFFLALRIPFYPLLYPLNIRRASPTGRFALSGGVVSDRSPRPPLRAPPPPPPPAAAATAVGVRPPPLHRRPPTPAPRPGVRTARFPSAVSSWRTYVRFAVAGADFVGVAFRAEAPVELPVSDLEERLRKSEAKKRQLQRRIKQLLGEG